MILDELQRLFERKSRSKCSFRNKYQATKTCPDALKNRDELQFVVSDLTKKAINSSYWRGYSDAICQRLPKTFRLITILVIAIIISIVTRLINWVK